MAFDMSTATREEARPVASGGFDMSTAIREPRLKTKEPKPSKLEESMNKDSFARGAVRSLGQGAFMGWSDELASGLSAGVAKGAQELGFLPGEKTYSEIYRDIHGAEQEGLEQFQEDHPVASTAIEIAGAIPTAVVGGGVAGRVIGKGAQGAGKAAEAAKKLLNLNKYGKSALTGATAAGTYGGGVAEEGKTLEGVGKGVVLGATTGAVLPAIPGAISRVISPKASRNPSLAALKAEGVSPTVGQAMGGAVNKAEEKLMSVPVFGDMIRRARNMSVDDFQRAAWNRALKPINQKLPKMNMGRDAVRHVEDAITNKYDKVLNKIGAVNLDDKFASEVTDLHGMVNKLPDNVSQKFNNLALDKLKSVVDSDGVMTSTGFKRLESDLTKLSKKLYKSQDAWDSELAPAVRQLRENLRGMLSRQAGVDAKELQKANEAWANFKVLQRAAGGVGAEGGEFSAAQLASAVKASDASKGAYARGSALMQDLSDPAKAMLSNKVANSGTVDRALMAAGTIGGTYAVNPALAAGVGAGSALYTRPAQKLLVNAITSRPESAVRVANAVNRMALPASTGAAGVSGSAPNKMANGAKKGRNK